MTDPTRAANPARQRLRTVTTLFVDVVGSTSISEGMDPEAYQSVMMSFFTTMSSVADRYGGVVEKFIGDAVMCVFGAATGEEDAALCALLAATDMQQALDELNRDLERSAGVSLQIRIGVNTGRLLIYEDAPPGAPALGVSKNIAARLQEAGEPGDIILGPLTYQLAGPDIEACPLGDLSLKGMRETVRAYRLTGLVKEENRIARKSLNRLIGRHHELNEILGTFEASVSERACRVIAVSGAAGLGKTRLAAEVVTQVEDQANIEIVRATRFARGISFRPIAQMIQRAAGIDEHLDEEEARGKLNDLLQGAEDSSYIVEQLLHILGVTDAAPPLEAIFWAVRRFFEDRARDRPLAVILEDMHWAEPTLVDLLTYVGTQSRDASIFLLWLGRPQFLSTLPAEVPVIHLQPLDEERAHALASSFFEKPDRRVIGKICRAGHGNPLFIQEMARMLLNESGSQGEWEDPSTSLLAPSLEELLVARLDQLPPEEREVLDAASVLGKVFVPQALCFLMDRSSLELGGLLECLLEKGFLVREPHRTQGTLGFDHVLVRDAAYASVPKGLRSSFHIRAAEWFGREFDDELLAYHLEQAYGYRVDLGPVTAEVEKIGREAARRLTPAGHAAFAREDALGAVSIFHRVRKLLPAEDGEALQLMPILGAALGEAGRFDEAEGFLLQAAEWGRTNNDQALECHALLEWSFVRNQSQPQGWIDEARPVAQRSLALFEATGDALGLAKAWRLWGEIHWFELHAEEMQESFGNAMMFATQAGDHREEARAATGLGAALVYGPAPVDQVIGFVEPYVQWAETNGNRVIELQGLATLAELEAMRGHTERALELTERWSSMHDELALRTFRMALMTWQLGSAHRLLGDPHAAETVIRWGYDVLTEMGERNYRSGFAAHLARMVFLQGRYEEAERLTEEAEALAGLEDTLVQVTWRGVRSRVLAQRQAFDSAEHVAREAVERIGSTDHLDLHAETLVDLAAVLESAGSRAAALDLLEPAEELYSRKGNVVRAEQVRAARQGVSTL